MLRHTDSSVAALPSAHAARLMPGVSGTSSTSSPYEAGPRALRGDSVTCVQASARVAHEAILLGRAGQRHGDLLALSIVAHRFCGFAEFAKPKGRGLGDLNVSAEARLRRPFKPLTCDAVPLETVMMASRRRRRHVTSSKKEGNVTSSKKERSLPYVYI